MVTGPGGRQSQQLGTKEITMQMHPMMIQQLADLQLKEARTHSAELRLARAARQARLAGTIRPERRLRRRPRLSMPALRDLGAI
jgi:hypothetical protein